MPRERDVRNDIRDRLLATGAFDDCWMTVDTGAAASELRAAAIEPLSTSYRTGWDSQAAGGLVFDCQLKITILVRQNDQQLRDETAEQLLNILFDSVNGQSLAGLTIPGMTLCKSWRWMPPKTPERNITVMLSYSYFVEGWDNFDVEE